MAGVHLIKKRAVSVALATELPVFTFWGLLAQLDAATFVLEGLGTNPVAEVGAVVVDASCTKNVVVHLLLWFLQESLTSKKESELVCIAWADFAFIRAERRNQ